MPSSSLKVLPVDQKLLDAMCLEADPGDILRKALTHRSMPGAGLGYERLEFLGDRVLGLLIADMILEAFAEDNEGSVAQRHTALVRRETLAEVACEIGLGAYIRLSPGEDQIGGRQNPALLSDVVEAVLAVIYTVAGLEKARFFVKRYWLDKLHRDVEPPRDAKTTLQEWVQAQNTSLPVYSVVDRRGPDHAPHFVIEVSAGELGTARGEGKSKREAEQAAARSFLEELEK